MKYEIRVKATGKQYTATYRGSVGEEPAMFTVPGATALTNQHYVADDVEVLSQFSTTVQVWEWYGDGAPGTGQGRYKAKGGQEIVVWATDGEVLNGSVELAMRNQFAAMPENGFGYKYELVDSLMPYTPPETYQWNPKTGNLVEAKAKGGR